MNTFITEWLSIILPSLVVIVAIAFLWIYSLSSEYKRLNRKVRDHGNTLSLNATNYAFTSPRNEVNSVQIAKIERKITELKEGIAKLERTKEIELKIFEKTLIPPAEPILADKSDITYYAKFPDTDEGFTDKWLMQQQNGEQVYELILTPAEGRGTFYISEKPDVQRYALSDINYYLPKGCTFLNQPGKSSSIKTVDAGTLTRSGNVWVIEEKIKIEFV